jgi:hypothetical protein
MILIAMISWLHTELRVVEVVLRSAAAIAWLNNVSNA